MCMGFILAIIVLALAIFFENSLTEYLKFLYITKVNFLTSEYSYKSSYDNYSALPIS